MMNTRLQSRVKEHLETLMADIRPLPSERAQHDFSYRLNEDAFTVQKHERASETEILVAHALLKVVHSEDPEGWLTYVLDTEGHWQPHADMVFTPELTEVMSTIRLQVGLSAEPMELSQVI